MTCYNFENNEMDTSKTLFQKNCFKNLNEKKIYIYIACCYKL